MNATAPRLRISMAAAIAVLLAIRRAGAGESRPAVLRSLLDETDVVISGTIEDVRSAPGGVWHRVQVASVLRGEKPQGAVDVFLHGAGVPESIELAPGESVILGIRWLSWDGGDFHRRLLSSHRGAERAGLAAADAVLRADGKSLQDLEGEIQALISLESPAGRARPDRPLRLAELAARGQTDIRVEAIRRLAGGSDPLPAAAALAIRDSFAREVAGGGNPAVLQAFLDLVRARRLADATDTVLNLALGAGDPIVASEAIEALADESSPELTARIADRYPDASPEEKGRVIRALARMGWNETVSLAQDAFERGDQGLRLAAVEALGDLPTEDSAGFLAGVIQTGTPPIRRLAIVSLARHRTRTSIQFLEGILRGRVNARERSLIQQAAPQTRIRSGARSRE